MFVRICLFVSIINGILGTFTTNPPPTGFECTGNNLQLTWEYATNNNPLLVQWKKDGTSILDWNINSNIYSYPSTFDSSTLTHDNANGQITIKGLNSSYSGTYSCEMTDSNGITFSSTSHILQVYDLLTSGINCSCDTSRINCNLPSTITQVTINNTQENLPFTPVVEGSYVVCMIGDQTNCRENNVDICETVDLCPTGQTPSTHLTPTSDVGRSSLVVPTDGGKNSLITISSSPDETMTFSSIFLVITETSSLIFQTSASSDISPFYISNTYTSYYLMSTLTTYIFGRSMSLPLSSSGSFLGHYSESSFKSIFDTMTSDLSILSTNSVLHSSFSVIDVLESSNCISLPKIYSVDSVTGMTFTIGNWISTFINSAYMSGMKSLTSISLSDSDILTQYLMSQITTSPYGIVSPQYETGLHIDHTPLTSFTNHDNSQLSLEFSHQLPLSPSFASYLAGLSTETLLSNHFMQLEESLTSPITLSNLDINSILLTSFTPDETSTFYLSSKYINSDDFKSSFDFYFNTKNGTIVTSASKIIETMALNSIAELHETKSAKISLNYDLSSNTLISSPITTFGSTLGTLFVHPTMVEIYTSMDSFFETFEDTASTLSVNSLPTRSLSESETVGIITSTSVETSNENTDTLFESSSISPSTSFSNMHAFLSLHTGIESDSFYKAISSANGVFFDSFSILHEKDSDNVLSKTSEAIVWSSDVSRISLVSLSPIGSSYDSTAYISTKYVLSTSVNSDKYSSATNTHFSLPKDFVSTILPSVSNYFNNSDIDTASSSLLVSSSVNEHSVIIFGASITKSTKVIAISVTVVGCILFVAITILVLFVLKLLQCKPRSKVSKTDKKFINTDSNTLSISTGGRLGTSLFDKPYGLPTRYYDKTDTSWGGNDNQCMCTYNKNWDDIT